MSHPGSAPRAPSNFTAWESSGDSALLSRAEEETRLQRPGSASLSVSASFPFLSQVCSQSVFKHTQIHTRTHTPSATWFELNRHQIEAESSGSNNPLRNSACRQCLVRHTVRVKRWVWDDPAQWLPTEPPSQPDFQLGLSSFGGVLGLDTACHQQARANEIRARLITTLRPLSPLVISWENDQGPVTLGWTQRGGQRGWGALPLSTIPERR